MIKYKLESQTGKNLTLPFKFHPLYGHQNSALTLYQFTSFMYSTKHIMTHHLLTKCISLITRHIQQHSLNDINYVKPFALDLLCTNKNTGIFTSSVSRNRSLQINVFKNYLQQYNSASVIVTDMIWPLTK